MNDSFIHSDSIYEGKWNVLTGLLEQESGQEIVFGVTDEENMTYNLEFVHAGSGSLVSLSNLTVNNNPLFKKLDRNAVILSLGATLVIILIAIIVVYLRSKIKH